ncbi:MAG: hypothetical protein R3C55_12390 [Parvularculaceae bacterium]
MTALSVASEPPEQKRRAVKIAGAKFRDGGTGALGGLVLEMQAIAERRLLHLRAHRGEHAGVECPIFDTIAPLDPSR